MPLKLPSFRARRDVYPPDLWTKCPVCSTMLFNKQLEKNLRVCATCGHHFRLSAGARLEQLLDPGSWAERDPGLQSVDALGFVDQKPYPERLSAAQLATGMRDAAVWGTGAMGGTQVAVCVMDFGFMGGSMGAVVGEKVTRAAEHALAARVPLLIVSASGGARMQEGTLALMQLAKTLAALERLSVAGVPFVSILSDPTTGGVFASFAAVGDVNIAEPNALIGFAGARVTAGTIAAELPEGFQRAEFLYSHGFVDRVVARPELRGELTSLLRLLPSRGLTAPPVDAADDVPAFRPLSFLSSIADRMGELANGDGPCGRSPHPPRARARYRTRSRCRRRTPTPPTGRRRARPRPRRSGHASSWRATCAVRAPSSSSPRWPTTSSSCTVIGCSATTRPWSRAWPGSAGRRVVVIGQQKGDDTDENIRRNFGMPHPEGYRKAMRVMELAERLGLPVVTFVDVPGAHPGPESEERGIAEAIARSIGLMTRLRTPIVAVITGEGGSGGALAIAVGDVVIALENAVYSVISPEGCASILWRTSDEAATAAAAMRMSAADQHALGVIDIVVPEPGEGAHAEPEETAKRLRRIIVDRLDALAELPMDALLESRYRRYRALGAYTEAAQPEVPERVDRRLADRLRDLLDPARRGMAPVTDSWSRDDPPAREEV